MREIGVTFGLRYCINYECVMNGSNSLNENERVENRIMCPICICKLKTNARFDCQQRALKLLDICHELGFDAKTVVYEQLLSDWLQDPANQSLQLQLQDQPVSVQSL